MEKRAIGNRDLLAGKLAARHFFAGLNGDVVVADIDSAFGNKHAPAITRIDGVGIGRAGRSEDGDVRDDDVLAFRGNEVKLRGILECDILEPHAAATSQYDKVRPRQSVSRLLL